MRAASLCLLLATWACSDGEQERVERSEYIDKGALCVRTGAAGELLINVVVDGCGSGCAGIVDSSCDVDVDDTDLVVHSSIHVEQRSGPGVVCPDECVPIGVSCAPIQAAPGDYLIRHAGNISAVRLPADMPRLLGGDAASPDLLCR